MVELQLTFFDIPSTPRALSIERRKRTHRRVAHVSNKSERPGGTWFALSVRRHHLFLQIYSPDRMLMVHLLSDLLDLYSPAVLRIINPSIPGWLVFISTTRSEPFAFPILDPIGTSELGSAFCVFCRFYSLSKTHFHCHIKRRFPKVKSVSQS